MSNGFILKSDEFGGQITHEQVFNSFGCNGENISPKIFWENAPKDTKSFAITLYDKDAPTGSGWWHWLVFDIPKDVNFLEKNAGDMSKNLLPSGAISSKSDFGANGYGGACPPQGDKAHQYLLTVHALSVESLGLDEQANAALVGFSINANTIAKASLVAYMQR